ncbi:MAG: twin-arginine translocation signal domain-containing protein [Planctomycetes bacterium]|nr:twin-arginine translocation signal domain-containing protein [Planctomycetota bacterium]
MPRTSSRRSFLKHSAVAAALPVFGVPNLLASRAPNEQLGTAVIGIGGQGSGKAGTALNERLVAFVDVDDDRLGDAVKKVEAK